MYTDTPSHMQKRDTLHISIVKHVCMPATSTCKHMSIKLGSILCNYDSLKYTHVHIYIYVRTQHVYVYTKYTSCNNYGFVNTSHPPLKYNIELHNVCMILQGSVHISPSEYTRMSRQWRHASVHMYVARVHMYTQMYIKRMWFMIHAPFSCLHIRMYMYTVGERTLHDSN